MPLTPATNARIIAELVKVHKRKKGRRTDPFSTFLFSLPDWPTYVAEIRVVFQSRQQEYFRGLHPIGQGRAHACSNLTSIC